MRLVATAAALKANGRVFESEGSALIAMASEARGLIGCKRLLHCSALCAMRIVAIHAVHRASGELMPERLLEAGPHGPMAGGAEPVDARAGARHERMPIIRMHLMTGRAGEPLFGMAEVGVLIAMAGRAGLSYLSGAKPERIADLSRFRGGGMFRAGSMARFACMPISLLDRTMRALHDRIEEVLMARLAHGGAHVSVGVAARGSCGTVAKERQTESQQRDLNTAHAPRRPQTEHDSCDTPCSSHRVN